MKIMINSDSSINMDERLQEYIQSTAQSILDRFVDQVTRIKVHLSDETNKKEHRYFKCSIEARLEHLKPIAVTAESDNLDQSIGDSLDKLSSMIQSTLKKYKDTHSRQTSSKQHPLQKLYKPSQDEL